LNTLLFSFHYSGEFLLDIKWVYFSTSFIEKSRGDTRPDVSLIAVEEAAEKDELELMQLINEAITNVR
jgi:hypothetical protein